MTNLWKETISKLEENNKAWNDVTNIYGEDFQITKDNFENIAKKTYYDKGYGEQEISSYLKILGDNFLMVRNEYDGSEWWEFFHIGEEIPKEFKNVQRLTDEYWRDLEIIDEI